LFGKRLMLACSIGRFLEGLSNREARADSWL
jgi:hypothetical protein